MDCHEWRRITRGLTEAESRSTDAPVLNLTQLQATHGQVWDSYSLARDFEVEAFCGPQVVVIRKSDKQRGMVQYQHTPRYYWGFKSD